MDVAWSLPLLTPTHLLIVAVLIGIVCLLFLAARSVFGGPSSGRYDPAAEQLRMRFARGEITQAEYEEAMRALGYEKR